MYFSDDSEFFGMEMNSAETGETFIIYDYGNEQMITLINMQGQKLGMAVPINSKMFEDQDSTQEESTLVFEKTGNEKNNFRLSLHRVFIG